MSAATLPEFTNPMDLPLPREAPAPPKGRKFAAGLRRTLSGSITIPDSLSESALKHRNGLRRLTKRLRDVDPTLPARASSFVGVGGMLIREIRGGVPRDNSNRVDSLVDGDGAGIRTATRVGPDGVETAIPVTPARSDAERMRDWRESGEVAAELSPDDLAGDALVHLTQRLATVVPHKSMSKPVGSVLVSNHRYITNRWLELSRIAADVKKHNAHLESLRTAITLHERVKGVLVAIEGLEMATASRDPERMKAYLNFLNDVAGHAAQEAETIAKRQAQLMTALVADAEAIAKGARRAHTRCSLFAVSALGALAAGVVLTGGAGLLVGGTVATLTAIAGGGMLTGLTCGALLDASDAHEKIERGMQEMQTVSERAGSLVEGDARIWSSIGVASRMAESRARSVPNVFQSPQWEQLEPQIRLSLQEARLLRTLDIYVVYLFDSGFALPGIELAAIMDGPILEAARRELAAMDSAPLATASVPPASPRTGPSLQ